MPWQRNGFRKTFLVLHVSFKWRFPGVSSAISATYLRLPAQISFLLSTGFVIRILGLGFGLLLPLSLLPLFVHAMVDGRILSMAKQAKMSIVGMSIAIW
jgi:hypothetical protein